MKETSSYKTKDDKKIEAITKLTTNNENITTLNNIIAEKVAGLANKSTSERAKKKAARDVETATKCVNHIVEENKKISTILSPIPSLPYAQRINANEKKGNKSLKSKCKESQIHVRHRRLH